MHLFTAGIIGEPVPSAEIEKILWLSRGEAMRQSEHMTPMTLDHVFPLLSAKGLW